MSKRPSNSRQSISSGISIPASIENNITSFEEYLSMAQEVPPREPTPPPPPVPPAPSAKETKKSSKYGIHSIIARNKAAVSKKDNQNVVETTKQKVVQPELREQREQREQRRPSTWRNLIKGVLDFQQGKKIPLLLAVEAGNQSMVRELLSAQTAEQLKVSWETIYLYVYFFFYRRFFAVFVTTACCYRLRRMNFF